MSDVDLKPCPFCRSEDLVGWTARQYTEGTRIRCKRCQAEGPGAATLYLAAKLWNEARPRRRQAKDTLRKRIVRKPEPKTNGRSYRSITPAHVLP